MKKIIISMTVLSMVLALGCSEPVFAQQNTGPAALMLNQHSQWNFVEGAIPRSDLDIIVQAAVRAPSAANRQPWHFTVVQNQDLARRMFSQNAVGNTVIVVSAEGDGRTNGPQILDCALAVQNMYLAAQALGYGSRIYTGPMNAVNANFKTELSLPAGHNAVALVRVGRVQGDAVSGASARKNASEVVTYK